MQITFINSFQSEWLKRKRSAASWLTITGGLFIPLIILIGRLIEFDATYSMNGSANLWMTLFSKSWQFMAFFLLPLGVIMATSLITQLEFKNNTWKQLHTTPQSLSVIFLTKLFVILLMMFQFFVLFNIGIYLSGIVPALVYKAIPYPAASIPFMKFLKWNIKFFIDCLPIIALQFLIGLQFKNFLVPLGIGIGLFVASMIGISWKYNYTIPYIYCTLNFIGNGNPEPNINIHWIAFVYFLVITLISYILYIRKKEKG
jgi:lantibiotic transport system permease protein